MVQGYISCQLADQVLKNHSIVYQYQRMPKKYCKLELDLSGNSCLGSIEKPVQVQLKKDSKLAQKRVCTQLKNNSNSAQKSSNSTQETIRLKNSSPKKQLGSGLMLARLARHKRLSSSFNYLSSSRSTVHDTTTKVKQVAPAILYEGIAGNMSAKWSRSQPEKLHRMWLCVWRRKKVVCLCICAMQISQATPLSRFVCDRKECTIWVLVKSKIARPIKMRQI